MLTLGNSFIRTPCNATYLSAQVTDEIANPKGKNKLAIHYVEDLVPVTGENENFITIREISE